METSKENHPTGAARPGNLLQDRYELQTLLGEGGFAKSYLATDRKENRKCVVKALSLRHVDTLKAKELFDREARVLANLDHPRIPKFIDFFTGDSADGAQIYLVQEYKEGKNLSSLVQSGKNFTEPQAIKIAVGVAEILEYLHDFSPPIIHRDIKPSNILLNAAGSPSLIDFGAVRDKILNDPLLRSDGPTIVGTYGYMPIEQFEGRAVPASDIYSLGVTLLYLLSKKEPWEMEKDGMRLDFHPHVRISPRFAKVIERMIAPDCNRRYASAAELKRDLEALALPEVVQKRKWTKRKIAALAMGALILASAARVWIAYANRPVPRIVNSTVPPQALKTEPAAPAVNSFPPFLAPRDVSSMVQVAEHEKLTSYLFSAGLADTQILDLESSNSETLWIATSKGILRFDTPAGFRLYGNNADIPGERVVSIAVGASWVAADLSHQTRPGYAISSGTYLLDPEQETWKILSGPAWDLYRDGTILWIGTMNGGVEAHDIKNQEVARFTTENSGLKDNQVHGIHRVKDDVWFASLGHYVKETEDFAGGGVSQLDLVTHRWSSFTTRDGLARDYSCAIAGDQSELWVAHWDEKYGLSHYEYGAKKWDAVKVSRNGLELGGVVLALDRDSLWIGQQSGLIRLNRHTREAIKYTEEDGLPGRIISGIVIAEDFVWITAYTYGMNNVRTSGLARISR